jgi:hypothetical protein
MCYNNKKDLIILAMNTFEKLKNAIPQKEQVTKDPKIKEISEEEKGEIEKVLKVSKAERLLDSAAALPIISQLKEIVENSEKIKLSSLQEMFKGPEFAYLKEITEQINELTCNFNPVELFNADNQAEKKAEFIEKYTSGEVFNPTFTYHNSVRNLKTELAKKGVNLEDVKIKLEGFYKEIRAKRVEMKKEASFLEREKVLAEKLVRQAVLSKIKDDLATINLVSFLEEGSLITERLETEGGLELEEKLITNEENIKRALAHKYGDSVPDELVDFAKTVNKEVYEKAEEAFEREGHIPKEIAASLTRKDQYNNAPEELDNLSEEERKYYYNAEEIKACFDWALDYAKSDYLQKTGKELPVSYDVVVSSNVTSIDVRDKSVNTMTIYIPEKRVIDAENMLKLLKHEIECHCFQSIRGRSLFELGGATLKVDDERLYEGLAKFGEKQVSEDLLGKQEKLSFPYYPVAMKLVQEGKSFYEVFEEIKAMTKNSLAFQEKFKNNPENAEKSLNELTFTRVYRVFRGHTDTSGKVPFANTKDLAYLGGRILHHQLHKEGLAYLNKSGIAQVDALKLMARIDYSEQDLPFSEIDITKKYWDEIMSKRITA